MNHFVPLVGLHVLLIPTAVLAAIDPPDPVGQATLEQLFDGAVLASSDRHVTFDDFRFIDITGSGDPADITVAVDSTGDTARLDFRLGSASRILMSDQTANLTFAYRGTHLALGELTGATLDIRGATFGTAGTGSVRVSAAIRSAGGVAAGNLDVSDTSVQPRLFDRVPLAGDSTWDVELTVQLDGGTGGNSAAVLSDFVASYSFAAVPEPATGLLGLAVCCGFACLHRCGG